MTRLLRRLRRDHQGVAALEFAIIAPLLILIMIGIAQMGIIYLSHAGLRSLVADGARMASISPRPTDTAIKARLSQGGFGLAPTQLSQPTVTYGNTNGTTGVNYADITMSYTVHLNFVFWRPAPYQLSETRRVYIYPQPT